MYKDLNSLLADLQTVATGMKSGQYAERNTTGIKDDAENRRYYVTIPYFSRAYQNDAQVYTGGRAALFNAWGINKTATDLYIQAFDSATEPVNGMTPTLEAWGFASSNWSMGLGQIPWFFEKGIWLCSSTTSGTLTLDTNNSCKFFAQFLNEGAGLPPQ